MLPPGERLIALTLFPEITPLEAAQIFLAGFGPLAIEQFVGPYQVVFGKGLVCEVDFGGVSVAPGGSCYRRGTMGLVRSELSLLLRALALERRGLLCFRSAHRLPGASHHPKHQRYRDGCAGGEGELVPS